MSVYRQSRFLHRLPRQSRRVLQTCIFGLVAGLAAVAFQLAMSGLFRIGILHLSQQSPGIFVLGSLGVVLATSLAVGYLLSSFAPNASGSGIPQLKLAFWKDFGVVSWRIIWVKFVAGVLSIGGGCSLGREGPSVQLAGGLASQVAGWLGEAKQNRRLPASAGAAAGLAAAFNTPLAAVTFVLEEIIGDLNSRLLGSVLLASVIGAFVVHAIVGRQPAFSLAAVEAPGWWVYGLTPLVAAVAALIGVAFQKGTMRLRAKRKQFRLVPVWARPALGGMITWALGCTLFLETGRLGIFGLGYDDLSAGLSHQLSWELAALMVAAKLVATVACYGLEGCGGIFSPLLFLGGMSGACLAGLGRLVLPLNGPDQTALAVVGMSACLGAVVRAPVTGILIVFEMTHEFSLVPVLMIGALVSQAISRRLCHHSFYDEILVQDGHKMEHVVPPRDLQSWQQLPVAAIANFGPVVVRELAPATLQNLLESYPYRRFPLLQKERLIGILTREEMQLAMAQQRPPRWDPAPTCLPHHTVGELEAKMIESHSLAVVLLDQPGGHVLGFVTLHDLLRAQASMAQDSLTEPEVVVS